MSMRPVTAAIAGILFAGAAFAQAPARPPPAKPAHIGMLCFILCDEAVVAELRRLGWVEGVNLTVERRNARGNPDRLPELAAELVQLRPDLISVGNGQAALVVRQASPSVPLVFSGVGDPVGVGLVRELGRPGGNATGVATVVPGSYVLKAIGILRELLPDARRIAVLINPANPVNRQRAAAEVPVAARHFGFEIDVLEARTMEAVPGAIAEARQRGAEAIEILGDAVFQNPPDRVPHLVATLGLPTMYFFLDQARAGGLIALGPDLSWAWRRQAWYIDRILRGASPADLPVEQPTKYTLIVNLRAARALGLTVPPSIVAAADEVIE